MMWEARRRSPPDRSNRGKRSDSDWRSLPTIIFGYLPQAHRPKKSFFYTKTKESHPTRPTDPRKQQQATTMVNTANPRKGSPSHVIGCDKVTKVKAATVLRQQVKHAHDALHKPLWGVVLRHVESCTKGDGIQQTVLGCHARAPIALARRIAKSFPYNSLPVQLYTPPFCTPPRALFHTT